MVFDYFRDRAQELSKVTLIGDNFWTVVAIFFFFLPFVASFVPGLRKRLSGQEYGAWKYFFFMIELGLFGGIVGGLVVMLFSRHEQNFWLGFGISVFAGVTIGFGCWRVSKITKAPDPEEFRPYVKDRWARSRIGRIFKGNNHN